MIENMFNIVGAIVFCTGIAIVLWLFSGSETATKKVRTETAGVSAVELCMEGEDGIYR